MIADVTRRASALSGKAVGEKFGDGEGVAHAVRSARAGAGPRRLQLTSAPANSPMPIHTSTRPGRIERPGQAEQQPARHIGRAGGQRRDGRMEIAATEQIAFAAVGGLAPGVKANGQHADEI